jgi:prolipoprotein diacylglyceryltransferase
MMPMMFGFSSYFMMWAVAAAVCSPVAVWLAMRAGFAWRKSLIAVLLFAVALILGSKILFIADFELSPSGDPRFFGLSGRVPPLLMHGFRIPGGFILMTLSVPIVCYFLRLPTLHFADAVAPVTGLMMLFTRLGCFLNGCCFGPIRSDSLFALRFPPGSRVFEWQVRAGLLKELGPTLPVIPLQLYFAILGLLLFTAGLYWQRTAPYPGATWMRICVGYFVGTLTLESMRVPSYPVNIWVTAVALAVTSIMWLMLKRGGEYMKLPNPTRSDCPSRRRRPHAGRRTSSLVLLYCLSALLLHPVPAWSAEFSASGTWVADQDGASGTWSAQFYVAGADVNGDFNIDNFSALTTGSVSGTLVGTQLKFGVIARNREVGTENPTVASFTGNVEGSTADGTYTTADGSTGTWQGEITQSASATPQRTEAP